MGEEYFYYSPIPVKISFFVFGLIVPFTILLGIINIPDPPILVTTIFALVFYSTSIYSIRAFIDFLKHKPAIALTPQYFQDNYCRVKIEWKEIKKIEVRYFRGPFLSFYVTTPSKIYKQIYDPITKIIYFLAKMFVSRFSITAIGLIKGEKDDILKAVQEYHNKYVSSASIHTSDSIETRNIGE